MKKNGRAREQWRAVNGFKEYEVSDRGRVRSFKRYPTGRVLRPLPKKDYVGVHLFRDGRANVRLIHRLVARAFLGRCPAGHQVDHDNTKKRDNRVGNLEYVTPKENIRRAQACGLTRYVRGAKHGSAKVSARTVRTIRKLAEKLTQREIATRVGLCQPHISAILNGKRWRHLE